MIQLLIRIALCITILTNATIALSAPTQPRAGTTSIDIRQVGNFHPVNDGIYRGARPKNSDLEDLQRQQNIVAILNLENDSPAIASEKQTAEKLGLRYISSPMSWNTSPSDAQINTILATLKKSANQPIFVHCYFGRDRTGLVIGLYRVEVEGWTPERAYQEMLAKGFRQNLVALDSYFRKRTGLRK